MSALEALAAALEELSAKTASKAEFLPAARRVGEVFSQAARDRPEMFLRGARFADSPAGLGKQFGTSGPLNYASKDPMEEQLYHYFVNSDSQAVSRPDRSSLWGMIHSGPSMQKMIGNGTAPSSVIQAAMSKRNPLRPTGEYHSWDTMSANRSSGEGTKLYATAFGHLANNPDAYNFTDGLSAINRYRRNLNMASAIARDPALADRIIMSSSQLNKGPRDFNVREYHDMAPEEKLGALHLLGAQQAIDGMISGVRSAKGAAVNPQLSSSARHDAERTANALDFIAPHAMKPEATPSTLGAMFEAYRRAPLAPDNPVGVNTLRKQALVRQILQGAKFDDLGEMFTGLEYRRGGRV